MFEEKRGFVGTPVAVEGRKSAYRSVFKRVLDLTVGLVAGLLALPLVLVVAALIMLDGRSPFYAQQRIGKGGRIYKLYKLRSMVPNADKKLEAYLATNPAARAEWDEKQKLVNDPRITTVGRFIRKTSLDELPQILNVIKGDMSLVGPRPMMVDQAALYPSNAYYEMVPGITGYWQISDRNQSTFAERATFDNRYHQELSFLTDLRVMWRTLFVVCKGTGV